MKRDQSYIKAVELFNDGEYEQAYITIDGSTSITTEELQQFKSNCLTFISQQYVYIIKDAISNSNYEEALSLKERFLSKYGNNDEIWSLEIPRQNPQKPKSTAEENHKRESQSTQSKRKTSEYVIAVIFLFALVIFIIFAISKSSDNDDNYYSEGMDTVSALAVECEAVADVNAFAEDFAKTHDVLCGEINDSHQYIIFRDNNGADIMFWNMGKDPCSLTKYLTQSEITSYGINVTSEKPALTQYPDKYGSFEDLSKTLSDKNAKFYIKSNWLLCGNYLINLYNKKIIYIDDVSLNFDESTNYKSIGNKISTEAPARDITLILAGFYSDDFYNRVLSTANNTQGIHNETYMTLGRGGLSVTWEGTLNDHGLKMNNSIISMGITIPINALGTYEEESYREAIVRAVSDELCDANNEYRKEKLREGIIGEIFDLDYFMGRIAYLSLKTDGTFIDNNTNRTGVYKRSRNGITYSYSDSDGGEILVWRGKYYTFGTEYDIKINLMDETIEYFDDSYRKISLDQYASMNNHLKDRHCKLEWYN